MNELPPHKATPTFIYIIDDILSPDVCEATRSYIDIVCTEDEKESNPDTNVSSKKHGIFQDQDPELYDIVSQAINENIVNKFKCFKMTGKDVLSLRKIYGPTKRHMDNPNPYVNDKEVKTISVDGLRTLTVIIALNSDYDGGEFIFPAQDIKVKLKRGQAIAFPPYWTHPHLVTSPENGTFRYTINTWIYGK
jgi:predicted 2-oxoglutarate/Fe(II)-dependent dioxygenase YbiX